MDQPEDPPEGSEQDEADGIRFRGDRRVEVNREFGPLEDDVQGEEAEDDVREEQGQVPEDGAFTVLPEEGEGDGDERRASVAVAPK